MTYNPKYPRCWKQVSLVIRRLANGRCERCGAADIALSVHHIGAPYANGRPGDPCDKHDIRRENLVALCWNCHQMADAPIFERCKQRKAQRVQHASLGVGTGLIVQAGSEGK